MRKLSCRRDDRNDETICRRQESSFKTEQASKTEQNFYLHGASDGKFLDAHNSSCMNYRPLEPGTQGSFANLNIMLKTASVRHAGKNQ